MEVKIQYTHGQRFETRPDWAERLQRTFMKKYEAGFNDGYNEGFSIGSKKALAESQKVLIKQLQEQINLATDEKIKEGLQIALITIKKRK